MTHQTYQGSLAQTETIRIAIVASRFNDTIVDQLVKGATQTLQQHGIDTNRISITWVPGAFEIPVTAKRWAQSGTVDAVICLGAVIRGATSHYECIANQTAAGISHAALDTGIPVIFGILTTDTIEQAIERSGTKAGNKGSEAAVAAI